MKTIIIILLGIILTASKPIKRGEVHEHKIISILPAYVDGVKKSIHKRTIYVDSAEM